MPDVFTAPHKTTKINDVTTPISKDHQLSHIKNNDLLNVPVGEGVHKLEGHSHNPLAAYCLYPDHVKFINTDSQEKIILILRAHPITNLPWILITFVMIISPFFFSLFPFFENLPPGFQLVIMLCFYLLTAAFAIEKFLVWFFNVNLITDERIFDVDFVHLMYREITEADLDQIQDVTVEVGGALRTLFGYGNVLIQTAAQLPRIEFNGIPYPDKVAKVLRELGIQEEVEKLEGRVR